MSEPRPDGQEEDPRIARAELERDDPREEPELGEREYERWLDGADGTRSFGARDPR